ncbi:BcpB protein [Paraburkholderia ribeironis]|uniref:BcpB protein n=1 Tax=Paraburkholderia ribeironis TaxID=1247936 RepID=A0A1N7S7B6_9BURK|nr:peroxiredoxin [Paraburkholderia ribeironis]SIT43219.1 BcpB protein [Paraburkholderia ribeironis]
MKDTIVIDWSTIPKPVDDGAANHLTGLDLPQIVLNTTSGEAVDLSQLAGRTVIYAYPWKKRPDGPLPEGWVTIPGAAGCTPQSCAFRDSASEIRAAGATHLFGLSTQDSAYQREAVDRLQLPFPLLSDQHLRLTNALSLPTFVAAGMTLLRRLTMIVNNGRIERVFYPVFPPDRNAADVLAWLADHRDD